MSQNNQENASSLEHLRRAVENKRCGLIIGPESSVAPRGHAGPPGTAMLMAELVEGLGDQTVSPGDMTLPRVAQLYQNHGQMNDLRSKVVERLRQDHYVPTAVQYWVTQIPFPLIISSAYDDLLDGLIERQRPKQWRTVVGSNLESVFESQYWKIFGTVKDHESLSLTESELEALFAVKAENQVLARLREVSRLTLLFVGFYYDDELFRNLYRRMRGGGVLETDGRNYFFLASPQDPGISWGKKVGLSTITEEPAQFLSQLARSLSKEKLPERAPVKDPEIMSGVEKIRRTRAVEKLLQQLRGIIYIDGRFNIYAFREAPGIARKISHLEAEHPEPTKVDENRQSHARVSFGFGSAAWAEEDLEQARRYMEQAIRLDGALVDAYMALHRLLPELGDLQGSMERYEQAISIDAEVAVLPDTFHVEEVLGVSNLGLVYKAYEGKEPVGPLAVTVMRRAMLESDDIFLFSDYRLSLDHPGIAKFVRIDQHHGRPFAVQEYVAGTPLAQLLAAGEVDFLGLCEILDQVAGALEYAHGLGIAHLNISPDNILKSPTGEVKLVEFREFELLHSQGNIQTVASGRRDYLAPEQLAGELGDELSDIYALGTICRLFSVLAPEDEAARVFQSKAAAFDPRRRFEKIRLFRQELRRISNLGQPEGESWIFHPLYRGVSSLTNMVDRLSRRSWLVFFGLLLAAAVAVEAAGAPVPITGASRLAVLLLINIVPGLLYTASRVRIIAQTTGYGSLIRSSHGLGIIYGSLMTLWHARNLTLGDDLVDFWDLSSGDYFAFALVAMLFTFFLTFVMLIFFNELGRYGQRRWNRYLDGFYTAFLLWCGFIVLLSFVRLAQGLINLPPLDPPSPA